MLTFFPDLRVSLSSEVFPFGLNLYIVREYNINSRVHTAITVTASYRRYPDTVSVTLVLQSLTFINRIRRYLFNLRLRIQLIFA